jgi:hypothetical protein
MTFCHLPSVGRRRAQKENTGSGARVVRGASFRADAAERRGGRVLGTIDDALKHGGHLQRRQIALRFPDGAEHEANNCSGCKGGHGLVLD